jgi:hypothetical protein
MQQLNDLISMITHKHNTGAAQQWKETAISVGSTSSK